MKTARNFSIRSIALALVVLLLAHTIVRPVAARTATSQSHVAVLFVLDNSRSMASNDPLGLRFTAAQLFTAMLDEGDAVGIVSFSTAAVPLSGGLISIGSAADKQALMEMLQPVTADGWTDVRSAFTLAGALLAQADLPDHKAVIVFLTDGKPEIPNKPPDYEDETLEIARNLSIPILSIALTQEAQTPFLGHVSHITGGNIIPANTAGDLLDAYLAIFGQIKDRTILGNGTVLAPTDAGLSLDPALTPYIETASFVIHHGPSVQSHLRGPDGYAVVAGPGAPAVFTGTHFSVITIARPAAGNWSFQIEGSGPAQVRAILRSRLRIGVTSPQSLHEAGQPMRISVHLLEEPPDAPPVKIIGQTNFSVEIVRPDGTRESLDRLYDDGTHGDVQAGDGEYTRLYANSSLPGTYTFVVRGWKGIVPVEQTTRVEVIPFPKPIVVEPSATYYEVRNGGETHLGQIPLTVQVGDDGEMEPGGWIALITTPSGATHEIVLGFNGVAYTGDFIPSEDGDHVVRYAARNGYYRGLPYVHTAETVFSVRIVPIITVAGSVDLGVVDLSQAVATVVADIMVSSTAQQTEYLDIRLEGVPGLVIAIGDTVAIVPGTGTVSIRFTLQPTLSPGLATGQLVFASPEGIEVTGGPVTVRGEFFRPALFISPNPLPVVVSVGCFEPVASLVLTLESSGRQPEPVQVRLPETHGLYLETSTIEVAPGATELALPITLPVDMSVGEYQTVITFETRPGVAMNGAPNGKAQVPLTLRMLPPWNRCQMELAGGGLLLLLFVVAGSIGGRQLWVATRPPKVTGTLRHWPKDQAGAAVDVDLTALRESAVTIGSDEGCTVFIPDPSLIGRHTRLHAEKTEDAPRVILEPHGEVYKGYQVVHEAWPLQDGDTFTLGTRQFQYFVDPQG